ncbi:MAG: sugar phosphate nucleotidyltransferase [Bacteroidota bacterium]|nr:sugar phosphate nucleotidyltransferase [Bacteroidota bacterium]
MKPTLVVLAAGIGSRYGGLKQLDPLGPSGETIVDYSVYDAIRAGFGKVIFVIKKAIEKDFNEVFIRKLKDKIPVDYVFQEIDMIPAGIRLNPERKKPWGTGHAVLVAKEKVHEPFAVINSDDFYGRSAYESVVKFYSNWSPEMENRYCMVGYKIGNTLSENGSVSRGVCITNDDGYLVGVTERTKIKQIPEGIAFRDEKDQPVFLSPETVVSMNIWGFTPSFFGFLEMGFEDFISKNASNPKAEYFIPGIVNDLVNSGKATVKILSSHDKWFGVTYREDREMVVNSFKRLVKQGIYPESLWK